MAIPAPQRQRTGKRLTAIAVADPSVTILENGTTLGVLLATDTEPVADGYVLHDVTWIRCVPKAGLWGRILNRHRMQRRGFDTVILAPYHDSLFVAEDPVSGRYFPTPRTEPYAPQLLPFESFETLLELGQQDDIKRFFQTLGVSPRPAGLLRRREPRAAKLPQSAPFNDLLVCA